MEYEELINFILDGYDNKNLKKVLNHKKIKVMGSKEVSERNRNIVLKNLKTKNNLFVIFNLWNVSSKKKLDQKKVVQISEENYMNLNNNDLSEFLYSKIEFDGMEEAIIFWEKNKDKLINIQNENLQNVVETKEEKSNIEYDSELVKNIEKKHEKERQNWQINNNKLNQKIDKLNSELLKIELEKKDFQKKEQKIATEFLLYRKETLSVNNDLNNCLLQRDKLNIELIKLEEQVKSLQVECSKRQEIIDDFREKNNKLLVSNKSISTRNDFLEQQNDDKTRELKLLMMQITDKANSIDKKNSIEERIKLINVFLIGKSNFTENEIT